MELTSAEKMDLIERFKDKEIEKLIELSTRFKANKNLAKAEIIDLILKAGNMDVEDLNTLKTILEKPGSESSKSILSIRFWTEN